MIKRSIVVGLLGVLSILSCRSIPPGDPYDNPRSKVPEGSSVQLHQALSFYPGYSRSFIQFGRAVTHEQIEEREPYCQFVRYEPPLALTTLRSMQVDEFIVTRSTKQKELAMAGISLLVSIGWKGLLERDDMYLSATMKLFSAKQPEVVELKCTVYAAPDPWNCLSVNQIKATLGSIATLKILASKVSP